MTLKQASTAAKNRSNKSDETYFVVSESGGYDYATEYDLDTFYQGIQDNQILEAWENGRLQ